ncbi:hypothetical protein SAMN07250955_10160 [Arboricoccus pini]|uniref:Uncharacterized protein n=1 Tax=Arboricoccus pini TaxID=1963835 RepID=A0A212PWB9_9PROT|nr:hypothetical protein [Arboricoccus pini]SNB51224.1 hypothetical protein SAMN07250955_10160 [Arboricoccus pini]
MSKLGTLMKLAPLAVAALTIVKGNQIRERYRPRTAAGPAGQAADGYSRPSSTASQVLRKVADMLDKGRRA